MTRALEPGRVVGRDFRVVRCLREGGMGSVYVALQLSTGAERALKLMHPKLAEDPKIRARFMQEAQIGSKIDSDHVVEVVAAGIDDDLGAPYLVMELLRGEELGDILGRLGRLPLCDVAEVLAQVGHALSRAHARGIVHRDLKPENLFVATGRRREAPFTVKILDFGIAKLIEDGSAQATQPLGTPLFMAPEQADRSGKVSPATDVWALGLIAFYMLTGRDFWLGAHGSLSALLREITLEPIPWASERAAELSVADALPPGFDDWFARAVARDPGARFPNAGDAVRAFSELVPPHIDRSSSRLAAVFRSTEQPLRSDSGALAELTETGSAASSVASSASPDGVGSPAGYAARGRWVLALFVLTAGAGAGLVLLRPRGPAESPGPSATTIASAAPTPAPGAPGLVCPPGMVVVEGGSMFMGERAGLDNARPPHKVRVSSFCLDVQEVTARAYDACVASGNCLKPPGNVDYPGVTESMAKALSPLCNSRRQGAEDHPINCVDWPMAQNFCSSPGGRLPEGGARLPTEAQWEYAARGSGQRTFPWGDAPPSPERVNACGSECATWLAEHLSQPSTSMFDASDAFPSTAPVGSFAAGRSASGVMDMAGNVWEWTLDWFGPYSGDEAVDPMGPASGAERVVRGGGYNATQADWLRPAYRWKTLPGAYNPAIGFRCAFVPRGGDP